MSWHGHLQLDYRHDAGRTIALDRHHGPLRVLQRLYPEGDTVCHHVLVHPPGGLVGGDVLEVDAHLAPGSHALLTTPGATRFYKTLGAEAQQHVRLRVAEGARVEWLPLETIAYCDCLAHNRLTCMLEPGAEAMGWDVLALGLPAAGQAWERGRYHQHLELPGVWLERALLDATDRALLDGAVGWHGHRVLGTLWFGAGSALAGPRREALLEAARGAIDATGMALAGATSPADPLVVVRVLAPHVEAAMGLLQRIWAAWRRTAWQLAPCPPRVWRT
jgi:urease accessory protein